MWAKLETCTEKGDALMHRGILATATVGAMTVAGLTSLGATASASPAAPTSASYLVLADQAASAPSVS